mmetsp:Transcript_5739/g.17081  ORF Transcript_5739/g.17081 Transcript_5739/m.17081 type:complete len:250 (-) Transcript_5739:349-1098(-)|eukprot:CAMPEP_0206037748 /NCGR_PEP_ID=MMETSP1466-20131121/3655_1 /ASSEMBLY_ACC=CAM_ASM_001126 /TAXON_ID=44452 /ORGANISM="Pavlova gyrans, Strain CCMP608" /LENGTH=249 /DNA_ID=CAMNT_0053412315 /DNA_START=10 /DNA_END=759 /DNA_ORIENTATION=-
MAAGAVTDVEAEARSWIAAHAEIADMNQYWYSPATISAIVRVLRDQCLGIAGDGELDCAFVSTPSLFYTLGPEERVNSRVLDCDKALGTATDGFVYYDFNHPDAIPADLLGKFRAVVIDPPFITQDVWEKYADAARRLLVPSGGLVIGTTVSENAPMMKDILGVHPNRFLPSIPNLPYQYCVYTNFDTPTLSETNTEVPVDPDALLSQIGSGASTARERASEAPVKGAGISYDFDAMIEAAMKRESGIS